MRSELLMPWIFFLFSAVLSYAVTKLSIGISLRRGILDVPNPRSSHSGLVPRVGGIGILCGFYISLAGFSFITSSGVSVDTVSLSEVFLIILVGCGSAATGLYDDLRGLQPLRKFSFQLVLAVLVVAFGHQLEVFSVPFSPPVILGVVAVPLTIVWLTGFSNAYNFMDGINGLAGGTGVAYGAFFFIMAWWQGSQDIAMVALVLAGSSLGFLLHNFPRAHTFMGDTGSLFLGMLYALLVVWLAQESSQPASLTTLLLICSVFLYDSGFTLLRRLRRRENIFEAHRSHLYQRLVQVGLTHGKVTSLYLLLHFTVGSLALVYLASSEGVRLGILGFVFLLFLGLTLAVGRLEQRVAGVSPAR